MKKPLESSRPLVIPVFLPHAGCPHLCVYCNQKTITGADAGHAHGPGLVRQEAERYLSLSRPGRHPVRISFYGGNFLGLAPDLVRGFLEEAQALVDSGKVQAIRFSTRPDTIRPGTLDLLAPFSVDAVELGAQSMDDEVLALSQRGHTGADTAAAARLLSERGYRVGLQMMVGLPGDTPEKSLKTAKKILDLRPAFARVYPTVVLKGSPLASLWRQGDYAPLSIDEAVFQCAHIYEVFAEAHIPVARMGLADPDRLVLGGHVLAGPLHPGFGHLVLSEVFFQKTKKLLESRSEGLSKEITLAVHPKNISRMRGMKNQNLEKLRKLFGLECIRVIGDKALGEGEIHIQDALTPASLLPGPRPRKGPRRPRR